MVSLVLFVSGAIITYTSTFALAATIKKKYGIQEGVMTTLCKLCCCGWCFKVQMVKHVQTVGQPVRAHPGRMQETMPASLHMQARMEPTRVFMDPIRAHPEAMQETMQASMHMQAVMEPARGPMELMPAASAPPLDPDRYQAYPSLESDRY